MTELIRQCGKSARKLVHLLSTNFSSFCDTSTYRERPGKHAVYEQGFFVWGGGGGQFSPSEIASPPPPPINGDN